MISRSAIPNSSKAESLHRSALACIQADNLPAAKDHLERALELEPTRAQYLRDLGVLLIGSDDPERAAEMLGRSVQLDPRADTVAYYGLALVEAGDGIRAQRALVRLRRDWPRSAQTETIAGRAFEAMRAFEDAAEAYRVSFEIEPTPGVCARLAETYQRLSLPETSLHYARALVTMKPGSAQALNHLATAQLDLGNTAIAARLWKRAADLKPERADLRSRQLLTVLHSPNHSAQRVKKIAECACESIRGVQFRVGRATNPGKRLRVGYLSGEQQLMPMASFVLPILESHDRNSFDIYSYDAASDQDPWSARLRAAVTQWRSIRDKSVDDIVQLVTSDEIDILIDVSGHLAPETFAVFPRKAAPVQVAFATWPATTGCKNIDYIFTDAHIAPDAASLRQYSETAWRMQSGYLSYLPPHPSPDVSEPPAMTNGYVRFGVFQRSSKWHAGFWDTIAAILHGVSGSKLLLQCPIRNFEHSDSVVRKRALRSLAKRGIDESRVDFAGLQSPNDFLRLISTVDIALDTWPYNGQTTTCTCLWMGVPVVTLAGRSHVSRIGLSILTRVGMNDWVAQSPREYTEMAMRAAADLDHLAFLRRTLRGRFQSSPLGRPELVTREMEAAYREMWRRACLSQSLA